MSLHDRWIAHLKPSTQKQRHTYKLYNAMNKYGNEHFYCDVLKDNINIGDLNNEEIKFINQYDSYNHGYNSTPGGDGRIINNNYDIEDIIKRYKNGESSISIAKDYNVCGTTICRLLRKYNIEIRKDGRKIEDSMFEEISNYANVHTYDETGKNFNVDPKTIQRFLFKHGYKKRKQYKERTINTK